MVDPVIVKALETFVVCVLLYDSETEPATVSVFDELYDRNQKFGLDEIIDWLDKNPKIFHLNSHITKDEGWLLSLEKDKSAGF